MQSRRRRTYLVESEPFPNPCLVSRQRIEGENSLLSKSGNFHPTYEGELNISRKYMSDESPLPALVGVVGQAHQRYQWALSGRLEESHVKCEVSFQGALGASQVASSLPGCQPNGKVIPITSLQP